MNLFAHIKIFIDIAQYGSLAGAARAHSLPPSSITASLQKLEEYVGARLISRSTRNLFLTSEGQRFLDKCKHIMSELDDACEDLSRDGPLKGLIRITSLNDYGRSHLVTLIDLFLKRHPQVRFDLNLNDQMVGLFEERFDLAIRTGPLSDSRLRARLIQRGGRSVCASPTYWKLNGKPSIPEDLIHHNCLVLSRQNNPQTYWSFIDRNKFFSVAVKGDRMANDGSLLRQWAISGAGVILKSDCDIADDLKAGRLETVLNEFKQDDINLYAVFPAGRNPPRRVNAFIEHLVGFVE
ncbi:LysR family transcriptional regulator [Enterobacter vonholyi]